MTDTAPVAPVEPRVFEFLDRHLDSVEKGELDTTTGVDRTTPIVEFCTVFFQQLFESRFGTEIIAIDDTAKAQATRLRVSLDRDEEGPAVKLISSFEDLCDLWPDVLGFTYGGSPTEFRRFHSSFLPRLLRRIVAWAEAEGHTPLTERAAAGLSRYEEVVR